MFSWFRNYPEVRQVVVNLKSDKALKGVLYKRNYDYIILKQAVLIENAQTKPVDGEVMVFTNEIEFVQVLYG